MVEIENPGSMFVFYDRNMRIKCIQDKTFFTSGNLGYWRYDPRSTAIRTSVCV